MSKARERYYAFSLSLCLVLLLSRKKERSNRSIVSRTYDRYGRALGKRKREQRERRDVAQRERKIDAMGCVSRRMRTDQRRGQKWKRSRKKRDREEKTQRKSKKSRKKERERERERGCVGWWIYVEILQRAPGRHRLPLAEKERGGEKEGKEGKARKGDRWSEEGRRRSRRRRRKTEIPAR